MKKSLILILSMLVLGMTSAVAQQITRFGVVDTSKVYQAYFKNSEPVRNYEKKKKEFAAEIEKRTLELQNLHDKKVEYQRAKDQSNVLKTESEITKKTDFLYEYTNAKNAELESLKKRLQTSDTFYKKLYETLAKVAENGGYSLILSLQDDKSILWYSNSVDVTNDVISQLGL